jgi:hypothetical protein
MARKDSCGLGCNGGGGGAGDDYGEDEDADGEFHDSNLFLDFKWQESYSCTLKW